MKDILLFGSSGALGKEICKGLESLNYNLLRVDIKGETYKTVDATNEEEVSLLFDQLLDENVELTGLINLIGKIHSHAFYSVMSKTKYIDTKDWLDQFNINLNSAFFIAKHYHRYCTKLKLKCDLINISSVAACGNPGQIAYSSSKAALEVMTQTLAKELGSSGHKFNVISPGFIDVESTRLSILDSKIADIKNITPLRKLGDVASLVNGINFILSSDFVTGHILRVDGGIKL